MFCQFCGAHVNENDYACSQCGAVLKTTEPENAAIEEAIEKPLAEAAEEIIEKPLTESSEEIAEKAYEELASAPTPPSADNVPNPDQPFNPQSNYQPSYYQQPDYQQPNPPHPNYQQQNYQQPNYQQQPYQPPYNQGYPPNHFDPYFNSALPFPVEDPGKNFGIASLVLGIVSLVACCCPYGSVLYPLSPFCIIASIVLGFIARKKSKSVNLKNKLGLAGILISIVPIILFIAAVAVFAYLIISTDGQIFNEILRALEEAGMADVAAAIEEELQSALGEFQNMI